MRGYGRDYDGRNWVDRAEDTVRGWFGGARDYDRDYGWSGAERDLPYRGDWSRGPDRARPGEGYVTNSWNNQHAGWDTVRRAAPYYGMDYDDRPDRHLYRAGAGYDRDYGRDYGRERLQGGSHRWMGGLMGGSMRDRAMPEHPMGGGGRDSRMGGEYGAYGDRAGTSWGDYNRGGGYGGGGRFRNSTSGGVEPGRYFRGYGNGSTGGSGYEPY
jgi:hypothetical protein